MRRAARIVALLALLCGFPATKSSAADVSDCAGIVVDENGVPLAAAKITLQSSSGQNYRAETDGAGRFMLRNLPGGDYKIEARKEGFFVLTGQTLTLHRGPNEVHLTL